MRKALNWIAIAVYYLAIIALLALLAVAMYKLITTPPCSKTTLNACVIDGWTVAGLAASILGVGATLLAIIGAVAVAAWWTNLNSIVDKRVNAQVEARLGILLEEQKKTLKEQTEQLVSVKEKELKDIIGLGLQKAARLDEEIKNVEGELRITQRELIIGVMKQDPWVLETWASEMAAGTGAIGNQVAFWMTIRYLELVERLLSSDAQAALDYKKKLENINAPSTSPKFYWQKTMQWQDNVIKNHPNVRPESVNDQIAKVSPLYLKWLDEEKTRQNIIQKPH